MAKTAVKKKKARKQFTFVRWARVFDEEDCFDQIYLCGSLVTRKEALAGKCGNEQVRRVRITTID